MSIQTPAISVLSASRMAGSPGAAHARDVLHPAVRPFVTKGIALVGASVIAVSTIAAAPPDLRTAAIPVASPAVQLTAAPSPFELYPQVVGEALGNAATLVWDYVTVGPGLVVAIVTNPIGVLEGAGAVGISLIFFPLLIAGAASVIASPVTNGFGAAIVAFNDVSNAVAAGDFIDLVNAIVNIPARIIDGVLNGGYSDPGGYDGGLLTPVGIPPGPLAIPLNFLAPLFGAAGIDFPFRAPVDEPPNLKAATVTLSAGALLDSGSQPANAGLAEVVPQTTAQDQQGGNTAVAEAVDVADSSGELAQEPAQLTTGLDVAARATGELPNAKAELPAQTTDGLSTTTIDTPDQDAHGIDTAKRARPAAGTDLTDGNKVEPGKPLTTGKAPVRDAFSKADTHVTEDVTRVSDNIKKANGGKKDDADTADNGGD